MRHRVKGKNLSRTASHRLATLRALSTALLKHKKITTTVTKAKEARSFVEPLITKAKENSVHARRYVGRQIKDKDAVNNLFGEIIEKIGERPGGYTRIVKLGNRAGDAAEMAILELVDYNEVAATPKKTKKAKKTTPKAEKEVEAPKEEIKEEDIQDAEVVDEKVDDVEEPVEEKKEESSEEVKAEVKEEPVKEETKVEVNEEPKSEAKKETKAEEPKAEEKKDNKEEKK